MPNGSPYHFRPVSEADFPLLEGWLKAPHVRRWWGDPDEALAEIGQAMTSRDTDPKIVELEGMPIGYLQSYDPHLEEHHPYRDQPEGTIGIDISIGIPELVGKGHGSAIVRQFALELFDRGAPRVVIDPSPDNAPAIRAYEKAGFCYLDTRTSIYGPAHFMVLDRPKKTD